MTTETTTTTSTTTTTAQRLESETCSRCGGSGRYSYCQMYGDRCFKCGGKGLVLTARGKAAAIYLRSLRSKPIGQLVVGDKFKDPNEGLPFSFSGFATIQSIEAHDDGTFTVTTDKTVLANWNKEHSLRVAQTAEQSAATWQAALDYQATLTKAGTPRKRKEKA